MSEERKPSRWERMRLNLVVPIGVVVAVAVICVVVAVLTSAHRADEVSLDREQQLVQRAIAARGERILREVEIAATDRATLAIRTDYDPQWVERSVGAWLPTFFDHDVVVVVDGSDQIKYKLFRSPGRLAHAACAKSRSAARAACRDPEPHHCGPRPESPQAGPAHRAHPAVRRPAGDRRGGGGRHRGRS